MKKFTKNLLLLTACSLFILSSCGDDDGETVTPATPSLSVSATSGIDSDNTASLPDGGSVPQGDSVYFSLSLTALGGIDNLRVNGQILTASDLGLESGATTGSASIFQLTASATVGTTASNEFVLIDSFDQRDTVIFDYVIDEPRSQEARSYSAILLAAPIGTVTTDKTSETFFSTNTGLIYSMNEVLTSTESISPDIDFGYFYGSGTGGTEATLSDPESYPFAYGQAGWDIRNSTIFRRTSLTSASFLEIVTFADIDAAYENATAADNDPGIESNLDEGEVLAFATDTDKDGGSKRGLILINSITPGDGLNGQIDLEILIQESAN